MKKFYKKTLTLILLSTLIFMVFVPVLNGKELRSFEKPQKSNDSYDLLVITPDYFLNSVNPLKDHKEKYGIRTIIVTLDEIYDNSYAQAGRDDQEKIKFFIKEAIETYGIKYVLLIGGKVGQLNRWHLPVRYLDLGNSWESRIIADLYYADIYDSQGDFSSWDSDGDGKYCEWFIGGQPDDVDIDLIPDVALGRLPCQYSFEVKLVINRIINYENKYQKSESWFSDMVVAAGDTYPEKNNPKWVGYEGEIYGDLALENMTGFNPIRLYTSDGSLTGYKEILENMNNGCGFVYFVGHGCPMLWSNNLPNGSGLKDEFGTFEIMKLKNSNKLPVCVVSGCHNLQFDVSIFNYFDKIKRSHVEYVPECWGWQMTRKVGGGSIATIGCTALGHTKEDKVSFAGGINELEVEFFKQYGQNKVEILGDTWANALKWYINTYRVDWSSALTNDSWVDIQVPSTWILFGDPSLKIGGYEGI